MMNSLFPSAAGSPHKERARMHQKPAGLPTDAVQSAGAACLPTSEGLEVVALLSSRNWEWHRRLLGNC